MQTIVLTLLPPCRRTAAQNAVGGTATSTYPNCNSRVVPLWNSAPAQCHGFESSPSSLTRS